MLLMLCTYFLHFLSHRAELDGLQETDPEFFKFLQKNDAGLLQFSDDDEDDEDEEDIDGEFDEEMEDEDNDDDDSESDDGDDMSEDDLADGDFGSKRGGRRSQREKIELTYELVDQTVQKVETGGSFAALKELLSMFRAACIPSGALSTADADEDGQPASRYVITTPGVYEKVMLASIETVQPAFSKILGINFEKVKNLAQLKQLLRGMNDLPRWKKLSLQVVSYFKSVLYTLEGLIGSVGTSRDKQQSDVFVHLIESLSGYIPFLAPLPRLTKRTLKVLLGIWSRQPSPNNSDSDTAAAATTAAAYVEVGGHALLRIRQMALELPGVASEECFRGIYLKFARQAKSFTELTAPVVIFMTHSVSELYGADLTMGYQQAFLYIRQLALHLRLALLKHSSDATREVTSMQFLNCLRLWTRVISSHPSEEHGLGSLAFPLVQIMYGVFSVATSSYFIPLKLHIICLLQQLAANCKLFIPTASQLMEVLESADLFGKTTPSTELAPKIEGMVKFPTNSIGKNIVRDTIVQEVMHLLLQDTEVYRFHPGLPEYTYLTLRRCKAFQKRCKNSKWRGMVRTAASQLEQYAEAALRARQQAGLSPADVAAAADFEPLLPSGTPTSAGRLVKLIGTSQLSLLSSRSAGGRAGKGVTFGGGTSSSGDALGGRGAGAASGRDIFANSFTAMKKEHVRRAKAASASDKRGKGVDEDTSSSGSDDDEDGDSDDDGDSRGRDDSSDEMDDDDDGEDDEDDDDDGMIQTGISGKSKRSKGSIGLVTTGASIEGSRGDEKGSDKGKGKGKGKSGAISNKNQRSLRLDDAVYKMKDAVEELNWADD